MATTKADLLKRERALSERVSAMTRERADLLVELDAANAASQTARAEAVRVERERAEQETRLKGLALEVDALRVRDASATKLIESLRAELVKVGNERSEALAGERTNGTEIERWKAVAANAAAALLEAAGGTTRVEEVRRG